MIADETLSLVVDISSQSKKIRSKQRSKIVKMYVGELLMVLRITITSPNTKENISGFGISSLFILQTKILQQSSLGVSVIVKVF